MNEIQPRRRKFWTALGAALFTLVLAGCSAGGITQAQATEIALEHAGITQEAALTMSVSQERENGVEVYDIQFSTDSRSYHYDIARDSGEIVNYSYDTLAESQAGAGTQGGSQDKNQGETQSGETQESSSSTSQTDSQASSGGGTAITEEEAKAIALEHAGLAASDVTFYRVEQDNEDGRAIYEVEFYSGNTEYDYEIAQDNGQVLSCDSDIEGWAPSSQDNSGTGAITVEQAAQLVLDRIPGATESDMRIKAEHDDGRQIYEGKVYYDQAEYEFEIDASTGNFIEWSVDYRD